MEIALASHHGGRGDRGAEAVGQWSVAQRVHYRNKTKLPQFLIRGSSFTFHQGVKIQT